MPSSCHVIKTPVILVVRALAMAEGYLSVDSQTGQLGRITPWVLVIHNKHLGLWGVESSVPVYRLSSA